MKKYMRRIFPAPLVALLYAASHQRCLYLKRPFNDETTITVPCQAGLSDNSCQKEIGFREEVIMCMDFVCVYLLLKSI